MRVLSLFQRGAIPTAALALAMTLAGSLGCHTAPRVLSPREFEDQWRALLVKRQYAAAESLISVRERQLPGDAEVYVARGNVYFRRAVSGIGKEAPSFTRGPTGGLAVAPGGRRDSAAAALPFDTLLIRRAFDSITEGIRRHPNRLDMRFGLAYIFQEIGDPGDEYFVLKETLAYAKQHPDALRWSYGQPLPSTPETYIPKAMHDYVQFYLQRGAPGDERVLLALAQLSYEAFPNSPYAMNDVAYYYGSRGEWAQSLQFLRRAERADSADALVLYNTGWAHENMGHRAEAVRYYRRALMVAQAGRQADITESSRKRLASLGAAPQTSAGPAHRASAAPRASTPRASAPPPSSPPPQTSPPPAPEPVAPVPTDSVGP